MRPTPHRDGARGRLLAALAGSAVIVVAALAALALGGTSAKAEIQAAPVNTAEPVVSGSASVGSTLTGTDGNWSNSPTGFGRQWVRCASTGGAPDGSDCAALAGATTSAYVVGSADVGSTLRFRVTATNADGSQTAASNATAVVTASKPVNTQQPTISGSSVQGQVLTGNNGTWTGAAPISYAAQWVRCPADGGAADASNCSAIAGATGSTYTLQAADVGARIRLRVTASNGGGAQTAASNATAAVVSSGVPTNTSGVVPIASVSLPQRLVIDKIAFTPNPVRSRESGLQVRIHVSSTTGSGVSGALVFLRSTPLLTTTPPEQATGTDGWATVTVYPKPTFPLRSGRSVQMFVRARKTGESVLAGVSTRRLVQVRTAR